MGGVTGDRGDIDDGPARPMQGARERARQRQGREKIQLEDRAPTIQIAVKTSQTLLVTCFRRLRGIVHQRIETLLTDQGIRLVGKLRDAFRIGKIGWNMVGPVGIASAFLRHLFPRTGDDPPARFTEPPDGRMADAPAGAG